MASIIDVYYIMKFWDSARKLKTTRRNISKLSNEKLVFDMRFLD